MDVSRRRLAVPSKIRRKIGRPARKFIRTLPTWASLTENLVSSTSLKSNLIFGIFSAPFPEATLRSEDGSGRGSGYAAEDEVGPMRRRIRVVAFFPIM
jgi:hypothetical protein